VILYIDGIAAGPLASGFHLTTLYSFVPTHRLAKSSRAGFGIYGSKVLS
jgi:hypothetical protein